MEIPLGLGRALWWLGVLLIGFALIDVVAARVMNFDITGVTWSPLAAGLIGGVLMRFFGGGDDDD